jgi:hypothetical protein
MAIWFLRDNATTVVGNGTVGWSAVTPWAQNTPITAGALRRQTAPTLNSERVFVAIVSGTTNINTEPSWALGKGARTNADGTVSWQEVTGNAAVNGDTQSVPSSSTLRSTAMTIGRIIYDNSRTHFFIASVAGTTANVAGDPNFNTTTLGQTTTDGTVTWIYIGTSFANWAAPHARMIQAAGTTWAAAGDDIRVADDHNETSATLINNALGGTAPLPLNVYCITRNTVMPTAADLRSDPYSQSPACAQMATTGANNLTFASGFVNFYGIVFYCGTGNVVNTPSFNSRGRLERCSLRLPGTNGSFWTLPAGGECIDCSLGVANAASAIRGASGSRVKWMAGTAPAVLLYSGLVAPSLLVSAAVNGELVLDGLDFSNLTGSTTLIGAGAISFKGIVINCKLSSTVVLSPTITDRMQYNDFIACGSGSGNSLMQRRYRYEGTLTESVINRTGGSTDGVTPFSWSVVTNTNPRWMNPFETFPLSIYNDTVGSPITVTIHATLTGAMPLNDDIWIEVEYLSDATYPVTLIATSTKSTYLDVGTAYSADSSSSWSGGNQPFAMSVNITPQMRGNITVRVKIAKASTTFFIDRKIYLS